MAGPKLIGLVVGLTFGVVLVWLGLWQAVVVSLLGIVGFLVGKYVSHELPLVDTLLERFVAFRRRDR